MSFTPLNETSSQSKIIIRVKVMSFIPTSYDLRIDNKLVVEAFSVLSRQERSILILHYVMELNDMEIGRRIGMFKSTVQRYRAKTLKELRVEKILH